ncbi:peptidoglycan-recognition protein 2-like isoform X3 [Cydia amplana]|uniref:peptidoglycan-recognition protein 2-like isoform X3 n=1 Tax=Cydia amplana TaxID=1869771 RepID=UPI002FE58B29
MWSPSEQGTSGSEMAVVSSGPPAELVARTTPVVSTMNISKSSRVHIGPKFVSVTQNVENAELVKGRILGLELVAPMKSNGLRCSVAVFVCWALVVAVGLGLYLFQLATKPTRIDLGLNATWYFRRDDWQAMPPYNTDYLSLPVHNVVIGHTGVGHCNQTRRCIETMLAIQQDNLRRDFDDIVPNFLIGGEGTVFEGRGANVVGAMVKGYNSKSISIMFMGDYNTDMTADIQFAHLRILIEQLVKDGVLEPDYVVHGQCQLSPDTVQPGRHVLDHLHEVPHWNPANTERCLKYFRTS